MQLFREQSQEKFFFGYDFVEARNFKLPTCHVKEKGVVLYKDLFEIFEILEHSFLPKHFQKVSVMEFLVRWAVDCVVQIYQKETLLHTFLWNISKVFGAAISKHPHKNICDGVW